MNNQLLHNCHIIRECFAMLAWPETVTNALNAQISSSINALINSKDNIEDDIKSDFLTCGIGLTIAAFYLKLSRKHSSIIQKRQWLFLKGLSFLLKGYCSVYNKHWKAECAYWTIFTLMINDDLANDLICDATINASVPLDVDNVDVFYYRTLDYLLDNTLAPTKIENQFLPIHDTANGLNPEPINNFVNAHIDSGRSAIDKLSQDGNYLEGLDYIKALSAAVSNQISFML